MCKFSIIVPCYNMESNIPKLFKMLASNDYSDYEVIFVDDCSKDASYKIMNTLKLEYSNYFIYQTAQNGGPGLARNLGLEHAKGEYIMFCDSDDEFDIACLSLIDHFISTHSDVDMIVFPHEIVRGRKKIKCDSYSSYDDSSLVLSVDIAGGYGSPFAGVYKSSIIKENHIKFPARMTGEDICFVVNYAIYIKKAYKYNLVFYRYIMRKNSITHQRGIDIKHKTTFEILQQIYNSYFPEIEINRFVNTHLLTKAKQMTDAKCSANQIREWFDHENGRYPEWIKKIDYSKQSLYRKAIYRAMYKNQPYLIKLIMFIRRRVY